MKRPERIVFLARSVHLKVQIRLAFETPGFIMNEQAQNPQFIQCYGSEYAINVAKYLK
jgi:hypothetical protein